MTNTEQKPIFIDRSKQIEDLLLQAEQARKINYDSALLFANQALNLLQETNDIQKKCSTLRLISRIHTHKGQNREALKYINAAVKLLGQADKKTQYRTYNIKGVIHFGLGEFVSSLNAFFKALNVLVDEEEKYTYEIAGLYLNIGNIYYKNRDFEQSIEALKDALKLMLDLNNNYGIYLCYNTFGNIYIELDDISQAEFYYTKGLEACQKLDNPKTLAIIYNNLAQVAIRKNNLESALDLVNKSLKINKQLNREVVIAQDYQRIGEIYFDKGEIVKGIDYLTKSFKLLIELDSKSEALISLQRLAEKCAKAKKWELAYQYRTQYSQLRDELYNEQKAKALSEMQVRYQLERKKRETELLKASEERIRIYADKLEASNKELERFAHVASHDMKEPLRMIHSYLGLITHKVKKYEDETLNEFLHYAVDGANRMQNLITEMLNLARLQSKDAKIKPVDINDVLVIVMNNLQQTIQEKNAVIHYETVPVVTGNLQLLIQLFQNLIGNGIKYNRSEKPKVYIRVNETKTAYHFEIEDNGIGIKEEDYERVFEMLTRLNNRQEFEGTGIGLATCKRIVEKHNGQIWVTSEYNKGSNFQFFLQK